MSKRRDLKREATKDVANAASTGVASAVTAYVSGHPLASAAIAGAASLFGIVTSIRGTRANRRLEKIYEVYCESGAEHDPERVEAELQSRAHLPEVQDVVCEGFRAIEDLLTDAALPALARLTRSYVVNARPADWFFRGVRRLLSDLSAEEFADFSRTMTHGANALPENVTEVFLTWGKRPAPALPDLRFATGDTHDLPHVVVQGVRAAPRIFHLIETNGLSSTQLPGSRWNSDDGAAWRSTSR
jgi:hypothetical protein